MSVTLAFSNDHAVSVRQHGRCAPYLRPDPTTVDPLGEDGENDPVVLTTERRLRRLAILACDVGARFEREAVEHDPMAWMLAPRAVFRGGRALDAAQERDQFVRATLLHGLALGLDADPDEIDALVADDGASSEIEAEIEPMSADEPRVGNRLFTCMLEGRLGGGRCVQAFCAMVATDEEVVRRRLRVRYSERLERAATVHEGFDPKWTPAKALVAPAISRMLVEVSRDPDCELGIGLDLQVEQRFSA